MSKLYFRYGAMNSGKSTHLMQVAHNYKERGMNSLLLKPSTDKKGGEKVVSRLGVERKVDILVAEDDDIFKNVEALYKEKGKIDCLLVDEVQFLKSIQIDQLFEVAVGLDIPVICYGLRTDFKTQGFEGSTRLLLIAHTIEEMKTICKCGRKALFNGRKINDKFVFEGQQIAIDNIDNVEYESLCGHCFFKYKKS
ncbi:thymidine kinase [Clostridium gasigenes]|uniref:Thymidine kinase n=1 Tax=Clostridium gasigenes TaxID=94869 RepID=A0A1H0RU26_9CLOT|nr:thymidine kinase [Clostridium gasigenes]MBB6622597.1 thymidine kinase [Clostridium gasigenes]MBU3088529.1 thymidine kinase [Clostridium gasigenes]MBU3103875.1 thymidine kinase [Clostridium gasigenes]MBU3136553.1 thymidine kinase [Clostridium gasigenes]NKF06409.1 thymidine kinase [Clostridium gasigenes]